MKIPVLSVGIRIISFLGLFLYPLVLESYPDRDARGNYTENFTHLQVRFWLSIGRLEYREGEDIPVEFHVHNHGKEVVRIFPALDLRDTFQLQIRDKNNRLIPFREYPSDSYDSRYAKDPLQTSRNHIENLRGEHSKEIALAPGEGYSFRMNLVETYEITPDNHYTLVGYFYPNATESKKNSFLGGTDSEGRLVLLRSENTLRFQYEPRRKPVEISGLRTEFRDSGGEGISPEETVFLFLGAELKKNWEYYFKWIYLPDYILAYDRFAGAYIQSAEREREMVVDEFKKYLTTQPSGRLKYYRILGVDQTNQGEARVKVYAERFQERIPAKYEYEYRLRKDPQNSYSLWKIHGVVARVRK